MKNVGQMKMVSPQKELTVEEVNAMTMKHYHAIVSKPTFKLNQKVIPSDLGLVVDGNMLRANQTAIVTRVDKDLSQETGRHNQIEIQFFDSRGHLVRVAADPRFLKSQSEKE